MAENYVVLDSYKTVQVASQTQVTDVQYITCSSTPSGIGFNYAMYYGTWKNGPPYIALEAFATTLENLVTYDHVVAGQGVQDLDANGLLQDYIDVIVQLDRSAQGLPPLEGTASIPNSIIELLYVQDLPLPSGEKTPAQITGAEYSRLEALAAG